MKTDDIQIRDPYVYADQQEKTYYLFGTTDHDCWRGPGQGFNCYRSQDLQEWDGTLHVDEAGNPWIVFCHEWVQIHNGAICALRLTADLKQAVGRPLFLFNASEARWVKESDWPEKDAKYRFPTYVTDGPFLHRLRDGTLLMLWSSLGAKGYAMGVSRSESGQISGPWRHDPEPIWAEDGGHGMIFQTFAGQLMLTFHSPNQTPNERAVFVEVAEKDGGIRLKV